MPDAVLKLDDFLPFRLSFTSNLVSDRIARAYQALFGLTIPEWRLVAVIAECGGITQQAIGANTRMDKVTVSRAAIALVERGLIERAPNAGDRRSHLLRLTASGRELYAQVAPKALELEQRIFGGFDGARVEAFVAMLREIDAVALAEAGDAV
ncbi:MarR family winged helix-turn-helix transcriptional regulator [soil metagenome]